MTFEEVKSRIDSVNAKSAELNKQRQMNIGKRETLTQQLNAAIADYSAKYGVPLTEANIESELARILAEKEQEVARIEQMIAYIEAGDYDNANLLADPNYKKETTVVAEDTTSSVVPTEVGKVATPSVDDAVTTEKKKRGRPKKEAEPIVAPITNASAFVPDASVNVEPTPTVPTAPSMPTAPTPVTPSIEPTSVAPSMPTSTVPTAPSMPTPTVPTAPSMPTPTVPTAPSMPTPTVPTAPSMPTPPNKVVSDSNLLGGALDGFVKMDSGESATPTPAAPPMDFASILGGSPFGN